EQRNLPAWQGNARQQLRRIQGETTFPYSMREATQRLMIKVPEHAQSTMTTDPIIDAHIILDHLNSVPEL
ncbi:MAG: hypothetical protein JSU60_00455, partial [Nitrospirota bacterium]